MSYTSQLTGNEIDAALQIARAVGFGTGVPVGQGNGIIQVKHLDDALAPPSNGIPSTQAVYQAIHNRMSTYLQFRGTVPTESDLPDSPERGDAYHIADTGKNYAWDGAAWADVGEIATFEITPADIGAASQEDLDNLSAAAVRSVNGIAPDGAGNVAIEVGTVKSVNNTPPDEDGNVTIAAGGSSRNLLDNPWFTVNQRGATVYTSNAYGLDRWKSYGITDGIISGSTVTFSAGTLFQILEDDLNEDLLGKTVTGSVMLSDGSVYFGTITVTDTAQSFVDNDSVKIAYSGGNKHFEIYAKGHTIKAVKLEYGTQSTLASDHAPDYATELLKCQRYFLKLSAEYELFSGMISSDTKSYFLFIPTPVTMRATPVVSGIKCVIRGVTGYSSLTPNSTAVAIAFRATGISPNGITLQYDSNTSDRLTNNTPIIVNIKPGAELSADL